MVKNKFIVTGIVNGKREQLTMPSTRIVAMKRAVKIINQLAGSIPKYKFAKQIRVERYNG